MAFLWLTRFPPYPPLGGGQIDYSRSLVASLALRAPVIGLAFATDQAMDLPDDSSLRWITVPRAMPGKLRSLISPLPNVAARNVDSRYLAEAVRLAGEADAIFVDFIAMAWIVRPLIEALDQRGRRPPVVAVTHNHEGAVRRQMAERATSLPMRAATLFDGRKADRLERAVNHRVDGITAITIADRNAFAADADTPSITLPPAYDGPVVMQRRIDAATPRIAVLMGNRDSVHKRMVLEHSLRTFRKTGLEQRLRIEVVGAGDLDGYKQAYPDIAFHGFVDDLPGYLAGARLGLLTDHIGGGFKIRAMSYALQRVPMLALREAMDGMEFEPEVAYFAADTMEALAMRAEALIDDFDALNMMQERAFAFASARFDPAEPGRRMAAFIAQLRDR